MTNKCNIDLKGQKSLLQSTLNRDRYILALETQTALRWAQYFLVPYEVVWPEKQN